MTVSDPEKVGDGMGAYVAYTIVTKVRNVFLYNPSLPNCRSSVVKIKINKNY